MATQRAIFDSSRASSEASSAWSDLPIACCVLETYKLLSTACEKNVSSLPSHGNFRFLLCDFGTLSSGLETIFDFLFGLAGSNHNIFLFCRDEIIMFILSLFLAPVAKRRDAIPVATIVKPLPFIFESIGSFTNASSYLIFYFIFQFTFERERKIILEKKYSVLI